MVKEKILVLFCLCFCHLVGVFAGTDAVNSVSVMEGDSVSLNSDLTEIQKGDDIKWKFGINRTLIAKANEVNNEIPDNLDVRFKNRLKLDKKTGSLTIMNIRTEHAGVYEVEISRKSSSPTYRFNVTVTATTTTTSRPTSTSPSGSPSDSPSSESQGLSPLETTLISAAAAGFLLLIVAVVIFLICRKHRKKDQQVETREEEITYADTTFHKRNAPQSSAKQEEDVVYAGVVTRR